MHRRWQPHKRAAHLCWLLVACAAQAERERPQLTQTELVRHQDESGALVGLSGLTRAADGMLWAVAERNRALVSLRGEAGLLRHASVPLVGVPQALDTESLASFGDGRFALGTESQRRREQDWVLFATVDGEVARITDRVALPYSHWGLRASPNRGIEGLCHARGELIASSEHPGYEGGRRFAPLARLSLAERRWVPYRLFLTTPTGKLASLACRRARAGTEVLAIERHIGVARVLRFVLPPTSADIEPEVLIDLASLWPEPPNFEGIEWTDTGVALLVDNDSGGLTGPTLLLELPLHD